MKNRRLVLVAFLLCASILVGVGYASFVGNLTVNGTMAYNPENSTVDGSVMFSAVQSAENCSVNIGETGDTATMDVTFTNADAVVVEGKKICTATAVLVITNEGATDVVLTIPTDFHNTNEFFTVSAMWNGLTSESDTMSLAAGKSITVSFTVTADVSGDDLPKQNGTFIIQVPVSTVEAGT